MIQGSEEWINFRKDRIGASDAPIIMGVSPWSNAKDLWEMKLGLKDPPEKRPHMERGLLMEERAREYFYIITGYEVNPAVYVSSKYDWMMASLDGISKDEKIILEIKCAGKEDHALAEQGIVPEKYYPQLQHQIAVLDLNDVYYLSFDGQLGHLIKIERNQNYIDQLIEKEFEFYQCLLNFIPPEPFVTIKDPRWENAALLLRSVQKKQKELEQQETMLKNTLISLSNGQHAEGHGVKLTKYVRKGSIDYRLILEELNVIVDEEQYRRENTETWKFTITDS